MEWALQRWFRGDGRFGGSIPAAVSISSSIEVDGKKTTQTETRYRNGDSETGDHVSEHERQRAWRPDSR